LNVEVQEFNVPSHEVWSEVSIAKRHVYRGMPEDLLQREYVPALDDVVAGERVARDCKKNCVNLFDDIIFKEVT